MDMKPRKKTEKKTKKRKDLDWQTTRISLHAISFLSFPHTSDDKGEGDLKKEEKTRKRERVRLRKR